jgi:hypothetical protein
MPGAWIRWCLVTRTVNDAVFDGAYIHAQIADHTTSITLNVTILGHGNHLVGCVFAGGIAPNHAKATVDVIDPRP